MIVVAKQVFLSLSSLVAVGWQQVILILQNYPIGGATRLGAAMAVKRLITSGSGGRYPGKM